MGRVPRGALPDEGFFHVYTRGVASVRPFPATEHRDTFVRSIRACEHRHGWICQAFTVLTTHYHLVLETTRDQLSAGLHRLNGQYASWFNDREARYGHVFAERFQARAITREDYLYDVCNYVVLNPVKARPCDRPTDWPWSYSRFGL